jgi:hypothetical protein
MLLRQPRRSFTLQSARHIRYAWRHVPRATWFAVASGLAISSLGATASTGEPHGSRSASIVPAQHFPIVNGHHVQPRPSDLNGPELTPQESKDLDELDLQIDRMLAAEAARAERILKGHEE